MGNVHPKPSFVCGSFLNPSVNPRGLGIALSICVNVNVGRVGIYSNFYFILFSLRDGGGCGKCTTDHALGSCRGGDLASRAAWRSSPRGPPQTSRSSVLSGIRTRPAFLVRQTFRALCLSCWRSAGTSARAFEDADREEDNTPVLGTLAYKGCPPRLSQLGAWRQDLPPWRRGLGLPAKAAAECSSRDHVPSLLCPAFQLNPNYKWV